MACNCGGTKSNVEWVYTNSQGQQSTWRTELEALAAQIRAGGGGNITTKPKA